MHSGNFRSIPEIARDFELSEKSIRTKFTRLVAGGHLTYETDYLVKPYRIDPMRFYFETKEKLGIPLNVPEKFAVSPLSSNELPEVSQVSTHPGTKEPAETTSGPQSGNRETPSIDENFLHQLRAQDQQRIAEQQDRIRQLENRLDEKDRNHSETMGFLASAYKTIDRLMLLGSGRPTTGEGTDTPPSRTRVEGTPDFHPPGHKGAQEGTGEPDSVTPPAHGDPPQPDINSEQGSDQPFDPSPGGSVPPPGTEL